MTHKLTHIDAEGNARMVDILQKPHSKRVAIAEGFIRLSLQSLQSIALGNNKKGNVILDNSTARLLGPREQPILFRCVTPSRLMLFR